MGKRVSCRLISLNACCLLRRFESELSEGEINCDPLSPWSSYVSWFENNNLTSVKTFKETLQQCIQYFVAKPEYNGDIRLTKIYIKSVSHSQ